MKPTLAAAVLATLLSLAAAWQLAPTSEADPGTPAESAFLAKIRQNFDFYYLDDTHVVTSGELVCKLRSEGYSEAQVITQMNTSPPAIITRQDEVYFVGYAEVFFCPRFAA